MAQERTTTGAARATDEELIAKLEEEAPGVLTARIAETTFDAAVEGLLSESPLSDDVPHFYCRRCGEYHLKTHAHYSDRTLSEPEPKGRHN